MQTNNSNLAKLGFMSKKWSITEEIGLIKRFAWTINGQSFDLCISFQPGLTEIRLYSHRKLLEKVP